MLSSGQHGTHHHIDGLLFDNTCLANHDDMTFNNYIMTFLLSFIVLSRNERSFCVFQMLYLFFTIVSFDFIYFNLYNSEYIPSYIYKEIVRTTQV